jgi:hypothetical protein
MAIHEQLPRIHRLELQQIGWSKATELAKVARRDGQKFESATWVHKARESEPSPEVSAPVHAN